MDVTGKMCSIELQSYGTKECDLILSNTKGKNIFLMVKKISFAYLTRQSKSE